MKMRSSLTFLSLSVCLLGAPACGEEGDDTAGASEGEATSGDDSGGTTTGTEASGTDGGTSTSDDGTGETTGDATTGTEDSTSAGDGDGDTSTETTAGDGDGDTTETSSGDGDGDNPNQGVVNCGNEVCDLEVEVCCQGLSGATCKPAGTCGPLEAQVECDGPEDCDGAQRCCAGFPQGSSCSDACADGEADVCHTDADCPTTDCLTCSVPGTEQLMCAESCP